MKTTRILPVAAIAAAAALLLGACGEPAETQAPVSGNQSQSGETGDTKPTAASEVKACMVAGPEGFDDKGMNQAGRDGLTQAEKDLGIKIGTAEAADETAVLPRLQELIDDDCNLIFAAGEGMATAVDSAAKDNPAVKFALIGATLPKHPKNSRSLLFEESEAAFLSGYAAAAMTPTGKVGAFVNLENPDEAAVAAGFAGGVAEYNEAYGKAIEVVDWEPGESEAPSIDAKTAEERTAAGKKQAEELISDGAGIILPPAGPAGVATLEEAKAHGETWVVWTGTDGAVTYPDYEGLILTSVMRNVDKAVVGTVQAVVDGTFNSTPYLASLENEGVGLAPWHKFDKLVPTQVKTEIDQLRQDIISGKISVPTQTPLD